MKLNQQETFLLYPTFPFHFDSTFYKPGHFPTSDTKWKSGKRWQTMLWKGEKLGLIFEDKGTKHKPKIIVKLFSSKNLTPKFFSIKITKKI